MAGKSQKQECEVAGHLIFIGKKQRATPVQLAATPPRPPPLPPVPLLPLPSPPLPPLLFLHSPGFKLSD